MLANRLRVILPETISEHQSAFVLGRSVTDNVLLAYECVHAIKRKKGNLGLCAIKLDMLKHMIGWSGHFSKELSEIGL